MRNLTLKFAIHAKYTSQRGFLEELTKGEKPLYFDESKLSRIITGHKNLNLEEKRIFALKLGKTVQELFPF